MTPRTEAATDLGGTGSVLLIWSLIIVVIGGALFGYSVIVTVRGRRRRRRRRPVTPGTALAPLRHPMPPPPASRLALGPGPSPRLPSGPSVGGLPVGPTAGGLPVDRNLGRPRPMPPGPAQRPLALPAAQRFPLPPPPVALPSAGPAALPAGPSVGSGYSFQQPGVYGGETTQRYPAPDQASGIPAIAAAPALYGAPAIAPAAPMAEDALHSPTQLVPRDEPRADPRPDPRPDPLPRAREKRRNDECAKLRSECEQLRVIAGAASELAAQAALDAETAHTDFLNAQRASEEARRAVEVLVRESTEVSAQVAALETAAPAGNNLQAEMQHAAFAAYRRGDISSEQLREVFKRAEGWTPEHDRLSRRSNELRTEEADAVRARDAALVVEQDASDRARVAAINARTLDEQARTAATDARGRCAAADACEQRRRR